MGFIDAHIAENLEELTLSLSTRVKYRQINAYKLTSHNQLSYQPKFYQNYFNLLYIFS